MPINNKSINCNRTVDSQTIIDGIANAESNEATILSVGISHCSVTNNENVDVGAVRHEQLPESCEQMENVPVETVSV